MVAPGVRRLDLAVAQRASHWVLCFRGSRLVWIGACLARATARARRRGRRRANQPSGGRARGHCRWRGILMANTLRGNHVAVLLGGPASGLVRLTCEADPG